jgi:hypothetical protein
MERITTFTARLRDPCRADPGGGKEVSTMARTRLLLCALLFAACSDDNNNNDGGVTPGTDSGVFADSSFNAGDTLAVGDTSTSSLPGDGGTDAANAGDAGDAGAGDGGEATPTFTQVYALIQNKCSPCHTTTTAGNIGISLGHLDMTTQANAYMNLVNAPTMGTQCAGKGTRVTPGDEETSIMYLKVSLDDPTPCGAKMPLGLPALSQEETDLIENWIKGGAPNN